MENLISEASSKKCDIYLEVHKKNIPAIKLYEKFNFIKVKKEKERKNFLKPLNFKKTLTMKLEIS